MIDPSRPVLRALLAAMVAGFCCPSASARAQPWEVRGQVVDAELGDPIPGVEVLVVGQEGAMAITQPNGEFSLTVQSLPALVIAQDALIETTWTEIKALSQSPEPLIIRAPYQEDNSVMVVAERVVPLTASTRTVHAQEFRAVPRKTAEDALQLVPGFTLVQHGSEGKGHQFFLRGFDAIHGSDLELRVEGVVVNEWSNIHAQGYLDVAFVIPETVQSVEVTKGPFTLGQGAFAMAGSANYELGIAPQERGIRAAYTFGSTLRHRGVLTYSPKEGDGEDFVAAELLQDRGFGQNRGVSRASLLGRWRLMQSPKAGELALMASAYTAKFELPGTLRYQDYLDKTVGFLESYDQGANGHSDRAILGLDHRWSSGPHKLSTQVYGMARRLKLLENYTGFLINPVHGDRRKQHQQSLSASLGVNYDYRIVEGLNLQAAVGARGEWLDQVQDQVGLQHQPLRHERSLKAFQSIAHATLGARYRYKHRFWVSGGLRADLVNINIHDRLEPDQKFKDNQGQRATLSPRLTAEFKVSTPLRLFAAYGRGFRPPEARSFSSFVPGKTGMKDAVVVGGRPANVTNDAVEVGLRWMPNRFFSSSAAAFGTFLQQETIFDHVSGVNLTLDGTRRLGGEVEVHSHPLEGLTLAADLTFVDARFTGSGKKIPLAPWLTGSARAIYSHSSGFRAGIYFMGLAPRPLPHDARGGSMAVLDVTAGYTWRWLSLDLELENALNAKVREGEYHYASHWRPGQPASEIPVVHFVAGTPIQGRFTVSAVF